MASDCLFCKIVDGKIPANRLYEDEVCIAFPDINPQAPTHILVIPKAHIASLAHTALEHADLLGKLMAATVTVAERQGLGRGYRVVMNTGVEGGQTVHHLHYHLLGGRFMAWPPG